MNPRKKNEGDPSYDDLRIVPEAAERRHDDRISPDVDLPCTIEGARVVHILGLSVGATGMRVLTDIRLPSEHAHITLQLGTGGPSVQVEGSVVWDDEKDFGIFKRTVSGIHFDRITPEDQRAIQDYLRKYLHREHRGNS
ncbi:MAG TPA: PilZ domain-containing protein [Candidatus Xenobia bacterium]